MTVTVRHRKTREQAVQVVDDAFTQLYRAPVMGVEIVEPVKKWNASTMAFSFTGRLGFIEVPLSGSVAVDDQRVTILCELPAILKNFVGEEKIRTSVEEKMNGYFRPAGPALPASE
jgi:hypothetical protein